MWIDDQVLKNYAESISCKVFVPASPLVVLGSGNASSDEVNESFCQENGIPVLRRYGGGGTVVLYSGSVVATIGCWVAEQFQNSRYFKLFNQAVIDCLAQTWPAMGSLGQAGISDIVSASCKVAGTSLFRSRNYLLYQASLLVRSDIELISNCLRHPSKEPDYRLGRSHGDFLTSLEREYELHHGGARVVDPETVCNVLDRGLKDSVNKMLQFDLQPPFLEQTRALKERLARAPSLTS
ncbi:MAG: hypothetical protein NTV34_11215 [Proteobacteria bacterium]|nr:hypothetical protein [Pseudomonadota bacterium]